MAPSRLETTLRAQAVHTWAEVLTLNETVPVDALIIHDSALPIVDQGWLSRAYQRGMVIAGFNIYAPELAELVGDACIAEDGFASEPYPGGFYVVVSRIILGEPDDRARIEAAKSGSCAAGPSEGVKGHASVTGGKSTFGLNSANELNLFAIVLVSHLDQISGARQEFEEQ